MIHRHKELGGLGLGNASLWLGSLECNIGGFGTYYSPYALNITSAVVFEYISTDISRFRCQVWFAGNTMQIASGGVNPPSIVYDNGLRLTSGSTNPESVTALIIHHNA